MTFINLKCDKWHETHMHFLIWDVDCATWKWGRWMPVNKNGGYRPFPQLHDDSFILNESYLLRRRIESYCWFWSLFMCTKTQNMTNNYCDRLDYFVICHIGQLQDDSFILNESYLLRRRIESYCWFGAFLCAPKHLIWLIITLTGLITLLSVMLVNYRKTASFWISHIYWGGE